MADEIDLFEATQNQESDEEDTYTMVASEIAVQKIRLEQKKEKARGNYFNAKYFWDFVLTGFKVLLSIGFSNAVNSYAR